MLQDGAVQLPGSRVTGNYNSQLLLADEALIERFKSINPFGR